MSHPGIICSKIRNWKVNEEVLRPYNACRLIPLYKNPGVRPIGVGEIIRRISARVILKCISNDLKALGGNSQLCLSQKIGIEHAIHSLREKFEHDSEAMLLIDAKTHSIVSTEVKLSRTSNSSAPR